MRLLIVWLINAAALFALPYLMSSIKVDSPAGPVRMLKPPFNFEGMEIPMGPIPSLGEHTDAILGELGIASETIADWRARSIV